MSLFITLEGPEGSGKTTQLQMLSEYLSGKGYPVVCTREPGGTAISEQIRRVILSRENHSIDNVTEALLFSAARAQIVAQLIRPALAEDQVVISDRYADSTLAYQGYGLGLDLHALRELTRFATGGLVPDLTFYIDLPVQDGIARKLAGDVNRLDAKSIEYHERVRRGYLEMARTEPERWVIIDGTRTVEEVQRVLRERIEEEIKKRGTS